MGNERKHVFIRVCIKTCKFTQTDFGVNRHKEYFMMFSVADLNFERNFYLALSFKFALVNQAAVCNRNVFVRTYNTYIITNIRMVCVFMCQLI